MRLIILTGLIVITFVFGFLFAHEPFRNVVIEKTVKTFFSDDEPGEKKLPPPAEKKSEAPRQTAAKGTPTTDKKRDDLTEKDRRQLEDLMEETLAEENR